jgi:ferredoxin-nitrate reductase
MVNSERRVTLCPAFRPAPGEARPDWAIFAELGRRLGFESQIAWSDAAAAYAEDVALTSGRLCDSSGLSHALLAAHEPQPMALPRRHRPRRRPGRCASMARPNPSQRRQPATASPPPTAGCASGLIRPSAWPSPRRCLSPGAHRRPLPGPQAHHDPHRPGGADGQAASRPPPGGAPHRRRCRRPGGGRLRPGTVFLPMDWGRYRASHL